MLTFPEELMLLLLDDTNGDFLPVAEGAVRYALAGSVLMDLALANRVDSDLDSLILIDPTPMDDPLLDPTLAKVAATKERHSPRHWVETIASDAVAIRETALHRLVQRGILERQDERFLWVFRSRRYPVIDGTAEREVKLRIMGVLFSEEIPEPRDIVIICLAYECGILAELVPQRELKQMQDRIDQIRKMDLIGQAVSQSVWDIQTSLVAAAYPMV